jgi:hypothetical protein
VILPFEEALLREHGIDATFVGHPLLDRASELPDRAAARREIGVPEEGRVLALFPGSRAQEIERHLADFVATARELALPTVPIVADDFPLTEATGVQEIVAYAVGRSALNEAVWREGLVFRPLVETVDLELGRLSFKAINPEYLLKYGE